MAWKALNRIEKQQGSDKHVLSEALKNKIRVFLDRYETRRGALLPALHIIQDEFGYVSEQAMDELAQLLEIPASDVLDTVTFYTYFWTKPRGKKVITLCRSTACEAMGSGKILAECKRILGIGEHETTPDGKYSLQTEECLAACDHAPCMKINERTYAKVTPEQVQAILDDPNNDRLDIPRSDLFDGVKRSGG